MQGHSGGAREAIELRGVGFGVAGAVLLDSLTLQFPGTGVTGLVGKNGSGKSTLLKLLARQDQATTGEISLAGASLRQWNARDFARHVAYLPQHTPVVVGLKVRELVELGRYPWHGPLGRFGDADRQRVEEALVLTSTAELADRFVDSLSGGEQQRVWLAMLLAQDARLLLLDEPISALDAAQQVAVLKLVRRITVERQAAVILVIHDINLAARYCDRLVALKGGRLIGHGPPAEFMTSARLEEIYDVAMGVFPHPDNGSSIAYVHE